MKVILFMAISLNGIIAGENNRPDFPSHETWQTLIELTRQTGCLIWGRKTHEIVQAWEAEYVDSIKHAKRVVVTRNENYPVEAEASVANSPEQALNILESYGFSVALLSGGGTLNRGFMEDNLVDEIIVNIEPVVIGQGVPFFAAGDFQNKLQFLDYKQLGNGIFQLHYQVLK